MREFLEEKKEQLLDGEVTITKIDFWLVVMLVFVVGVLYGLKKAPWTHGVNMNIGSNNGNNNNVNEADEECDECECIGCCECGEEDDDEDVLPFN